MAIHDKAFQGRGKARFLVPGVFFCLHYPALKLPLFGPYFVSDGLYLPRAYILYGPKEGKGINGKSWPSQWPWKSISNALIDSWMLAPWLLLTLPYNSPYKAPILALTGLNNPRHTSYIHKKKKGLQAKCGLLVALREKALSKG